MGRNNSIGSLFIDIQARTAKLEQDLGKVRGILEGTAADVQKVSKNTELLGENGEVKFLKFATAAFGAQSSVRLLAREFRYVYDNIEQIRGIDPTVTASVMQLKSNISDARVELDKFIAGRLAWFADFGTAVGISFANAGTALPKGDYAPDSPKTALLDKEAQDRDVNYNEKVIQLARELAAAKDKARIAGLTEAEQITELSEKAARYMEISKHSNISSYEQGMLRLEGYKLQQAANEKLTGLHKQLAAAQVTVHNSMERGTVATVSNAERVDILSQRTMKLRQDLMYLAEAQENWKKSNNGKENAEMLQTQIDLTKQLGVTQAQLNTALAKQGALFRDLGASMAQNFENAIIKGGTLRSILQGIGMDILQIIVRQQITTPLADFIGGSGGLLSTIFGGHAMGGPLDGPSIVGENGPELLVPSSAGGSIIPNDKLSSGGGGSTYYIDARSADRSGLDNVYALIRKLNGSIETRALNAVNSQNKRRPY